jgi:glycosyltransferase involved in cell wall biosynthesis
MRRPGPLHTFQPILDPHEFKGGPIVMVNSGLAPGGVERQIVNTLLSLDRRTDCKLGLLCWRLGQESELEFFKPLLAGFSGFVRDVMNSTDACQVLRTLLPHSLVQRIEDQITWMPWDARAEVVRLIAEFARLKPAVVHGWQDDSAIPAAYAARLIGVPRILISTRNVRPTNFIWYRPHMYYSYQELAQCHEIAMINNSEAGAIDYECWLGLSDDRFVVKRNAFDARTMRRPDPQTVIELRARLGIPRDAPVVGSIYRFSEEKRPLLWIETAIEISRARPDCHFVIFGSGPMRGRIETICRRRGLAKKLHLPGAITDTALGLSLFDIFLLTSRAEGTPNVVLEASALGIPVVATEAGGIREAIDEGTTGYLVEQAQPSVIANSILRVLQAANWRAGIRIAGPDFVERRFGLDRMIAETLKLYGLPQAEPSPMSHIRLVN